MSSFVSNGKNMITFSQFCLNESIVPKKISFGLDDLCSNSKITHQMNFYFTFFNEKEYNINYCVIISDENSVGFGASKIQKDLEKNILKFSDRQISGGQAITVFSNVFYVLIQMIAELKINEIKFDPANAALGKMYKKLVKNKSFLKALKAHGFSYSKNDGEFFIFTKN